MNARPNPKLDPKTKTDAAKELALFSETNDPQGAFGQLKLVSLDLAAAGEDENKDHVGPHHPRTGKNLEDRHKGKRGKPYKKHIKPVEIKCSPTVMPRGILAATSSTHQSAPPLYKSTDPWAEYNFLKDTDTGRILAALGIWSSQLPKRASRQQCNHQVICPMLRMMKLGGNRQVRGSTSYLVL